LRLGDNGARNTARADHNVALPHLAIESRRFARVGAKSQSKKRMYSLALHDPVRTRFLAGIGGMPQQTDAGNSTASEAAMAAVLSREPSSTTMISYSF